MYNQYNIFQCRVTQVYGNSFDNANISIKYYAWERALSTCTSVQLCWTALILAWMTSEVQWASQTSMATMNECLSSWESSSRGSSSRPAELRYFPHERQGMVVLCLIACDKLSSSSLSTDSSAGTHTTWGERQTEQMILFKMKSIGCHLMKLNKYSKGKQALLKGVPTSNSVMKTTEFLSTF